MQLLPKVTGCNFTYEHYFDTLDRARDRGHAVLPLCEHSTEAAKAIFLRHDVDMSLESAIVLARMEYEHKLRATYFIHLHSKYYNALDGDSLKQMTELLALGHEVGLHYDTSLGGLVVHEANLLESILGKKIQTISQHDPGISETLQNSAHLCDVKNIKAKYLSDSVQRWREGCLCENFDKYEKIQVLTHPIWWSETGANRSLQLERLKMEMEKKVHTLSELTNKMHLRYLKNLA